MECKLPLWTWVNNYSLHQPWTFFTKLVGMNLLKVNLKGLERGKLKNKRNSPIQTTSSLLDLHWQQNINGVHVVSFSLTDFGSQWISRLLPILVTMQEKGPLEIHLFYEHQRLCLFQKKHLEIFFWPSQTMKSPSTNSSESYIYMPRKPLPHAQMTLL